MATLDDYPYDWSLVYDGEDLRISTAPGAYRMDFPGRRVEIWEWDDEGALFYIEQDNDRVVPEPGRGPKRTTKRVLEPIFEDEAV